MSQTDRELRRVLRETRRLVEDAREVNEKFLEQEKKIKNLEKTLKMQENVLLRARHLEVHVEHASLGHPALPDATLPELSFQEWCYFYNMQWCVNGEYKEAREVMDLENIFHERSMLEGDYRPPSVDAFIRGETIKSQPPRVYRPELFYDDRFFLKVPELPRSRSRSPVRSEEGADAAVESSDEYWIESAQNNPDDVIPPS
jgi:hypothetical protein